jgi:hypothetical protein
VWAKLFYLVRTGHVDEALDEALGAQRALESREPGFVAHFRAWAEAADRRLPKALREHLQATYNTHMLHAGTADPFKLALYKLMGKLEPTRRSVPLATATTEDWLWFQLAMVQCAAEFVGERDLCARRWTRKRATGSPPLRTSCSGTASAISTACQARAQNAVCGPACSSCAASLSGWAAPYAAMVSR